MSDLTLYELAPSPNSIKVRLALGLRKIPCALVPVNPMDRATVVELSGQPLTPVLKDRDRVVYDSYGILRYLDANFPGEPRLYSPERATQQAIEQWELHARTQLGACIGMIFNQLFSPEKDPSEIARANELLAERTDKIEAALADHPFLMGEAPNAADLSCASFTCYGLLDPAAWPEGSIQSYFAANLRLPARFERTAAWTARVLAFDCAKQ